MFVQHKILLNLFLVIFTYFYKNRCRKALQGQEIRGFPMSKRLQDSIPHHSPFQISAYWNLSKKWPGFPKPSVKQNSEAIPSAYALPQSKALPHKCLLSTKFPYSDSYFHVQKGLSLMYACTFSIMPLLAQIYQIR